MSLTIATKTYNKDVNPTPDSARFYGPAQTSSVKDSVTVKRVSAKPTKDFAGVARQAVKTVKSCVINGITRDLIAETTFSAPVGVDAALLTALRVDHSSTIGLSMVQVLVDSSILPT